jgi:hypothetical protein
MKSSREPSSCTSFPFFSGEAKEVLALLHFTRHLQDKIGPNCLAQEEIALFRLARRFLNCAHQTRYTIEDLFIFFPLPDSQDARN